MNPFARLPLCAGVAVVLGCTSLFLLAKLGGPRVQEKLDLVQVASRCGDDMHRSEALEVNQHAIARRWAEQQRIAQELIAGRMTVREALCQFRELNAALREAVPKEQPQPPLDEDSLRRNLLIWVQKEAADQPSVAAKLEQEILEPTKSDE
jgi:hypothetical protein